MILRHLLFHLHCNITHPPPPRLGGSLKYTPEQRREDIYVNSVTWNSSNEMNFQ